MPVKRKKRKTKRKYNKKSKASKKQALNWSIWGLVLILLAVFAFVRFGILGKQIANLIRIFFGDSYLFASGILALFGLVNLIYNQPIKLPVKRSIGLCLAFLGILLLQSGIYFEHELVNSNFLNSFWHAMSAEFGRAGVTESVGGGLFGSLGYQIFYPLLGQIGVKVFAVLLMPIGILMFFDVKFRTIIEKFQSVGQLFIQKNKEAGTRLKDKYSDVASKRFKPILQNKIVQMS